jgi:hypothetical protein
MCLSKIFLMKHLVGKGTPKLEKFMISEYSLIANKHNNLQGIYFCEICQIIMINCQLLKWLNYIEKRSEKNGSTSISWKCLFAAYTSEDL